MKMHEVVIKMVFLVLDQIYISPIFCKMTANTHTYELILKVQQKLNLLFFWNIFKSLSH